MKKYIYILLIVIPVVNFIFMLNGFNNGLFARFEILDTGMYYYKFDFSMYFNRFLDITTDYFDKNFIIKFVEIKDYFNFDNWWHAFCTIINVLLYVINLLIFLPLNFLAFSMNFVFSLVGFYIDDFINVLTNLGIPYIPV